MQFSVSPVLYIACFISYRVTDYKMGHWAFSQILFQMQFCFPCVARGRMKAQLEVVHCKTILGFFQFHCTISFYIATCAFAVSIKSLPLKGI